MPPAIWNVSVIVVWNPTETVMMAIVRLASMLTEAFTVTWLAYSVSRAMAAVTDSRTKTDSLMIPRSTAPWRSPIRLTVAANQ